MQSTLTAFFLGPGARRHARLEEGASLEWRRAQTARLLLPWPRVRARRVGRPSRRTEWRQGLGQLIDAMDRSVEELGPEPPAWWRHGQPVQLMMATVKEYVVAQEDIVMAAVAEPAGDEPAAHGDGAGDDKPAEPCTKRRKTHMLPEVKEWFCSLARVKRDWTMTQCLRFAKRALPSFFEHAHIDTTRKWLSHKTSSTALGRPRSLEPAAVLALADIVSRVCSRVCCGARVWAELLNAHQSASTRSRCSSAARPHGSFVTVKTQASSRLSGHRARRILLQSIIIAFYFGVFFLLPVQHAHAVFARISVYGSQNPQLFLCTSITKIDCSSSSSSGWRCTTARQAVGDLVQDTSSRPPLGPLVPTERDKYVRLVQSRRRPEKWNRTRKAGSRGLVTPDPVS